MKRTNWIAGKYSARQAGPPDKCFYCGVRLGEPHRPDCNIRHRTVVIEARIQYVVEVPEDWDGEQINFHRNESSWCCDNGLSEIDNLVKRLPEGKCSCGRMEYAFLREATEQDEADDLLFVKDCES